MRIGIDARVLGSPRVGMGTHLYNVLKCIQEIETSNEFFLYSYKKITADLSASQFTRRDIPGTFIKKGLWWYFTILPKLIKDDKIDLFWGSSQVLPPNTAQSVRAVVTIHDLVYHLYPQYMTLYNLWISKLLIPRSLYKTDTIVAVSPLVKKDLYTVYGESVSSKVVVIGEGVDQEHFVPHMEPNVLKKYGIDQKYILSVGTIEPRKNYRQIIEVFTQTPELCNNYYLVIAGTFGWKYKSLLQYLGRNPVSKKILLLGYVPESELRMLYTASTLFVLPSHYEGFALPVLEAIACGAPVLLPDLAWACNLLGTTGNYYKHNDLDNFKEVMLRTLQQDTDAPNSKELLKKYHWHNTALEYLKVFNGL